MIFYDIMSAKSIGTHCTNSSHKGVILRPNDFLKNVQQRCQLVTRDAAPLTR